MAARLQLSCGLRGSCKSARQGLGFPASDADAKGTPRPYLPPDIVRLIDAIMRAAERAEMLRTMHGGNFGRTLLCLRLLAQAACWTCASCWPRARTLVR